MPFPFTNERNMSEQEKSTTSDLAEIDSTTVKASVSGSFIQEIRNWIQICDLQHTCLTESERHKGPTWLIDTREHCIVRGTDKRYIALSYTWQETSSSLPTEQQRPFQLTLETLSLLQHQGSISTSEIANQLPKVVKDAIELVPLIEDRYLWIDRLCIIQGEHSTNLEVMRMDEIYSGAHLTLIAAARQGLYRDHGTTALNARLEQVPLLQSRETTILLNLHSDDENYCHDIQIKSHYEQLAQSRWATRAWTYQEHIFSKRVVFFLDDRVFWECSRSVWDMHGLSSGTNISGGPTIADLGMRLITTTWPDFSLYVDLICAYNGRDLTFSSDGLSACSGILNRLTRAFPEGFIYGLPRGRFDDALLWQPIRGCHRRVNSGSNTDSPLPSWSWCGWQCYVDPRSFLSGDWALQDPMDKPRTSSWTTHKCVLWNILTYRGEKVPITEYIESDITPQLVCKTEQASFYIADILQVIESPSHKRRGGRLKAFGNPVLTDKPLNQMLPVIVLRDTNGRFSGLLRATIDIECNQGDMIELVTISKGSANHCDIEGCIEERLFGRSQDYGSEPFEASFDTNGLWVDDPSGRDCDFYSIEYKGDDVLELTQVEDYWGNHDTCRFYNVLWVQKKEGICYRVACGRIEEKVWKLNQTGDIELILS